MSFFIRLLEMTDASRCQLEAVQKIQIMLNGRMTKEEYQLFLMDLYHIVLHFCPIMEVASKRCSDELLDVRMYLARKIADEAGHEKMILADLATFSVAEQSVISRLPSYPVQAMLAYNYYACEHIHPCCVVGMLYALELISSIYGGQLASAISAGLDRPMQNGFTYLESHSTMDLDHVAELRALLQKIDSLDMQQIIIDAIQMNFYLFTTFLKDESN
jgi:pyrroloquinoline quinone (PQQ) biosynthesis protein C